MHTPPLPTQYNGQRFPTAIIAHAVWLYFRFPLSYRQLEEILAARGISVRYETIREGCGKFGQTYANALQRRRAQPGDKWHLDDVFLKINGKTHDLWRAVDQYGNVLDILVTARRDPHAAKRFFRQVLKRCHDVPRVIITDQLASYGAAKREILPGVEDRQHKGLNNRAANAHQPTRQQEHKMRRFKSAGLPNAFYRPLNRLRGISGCHGTAWRRPITKRNDCADSRLGIS